MANSPRPKVMGKVVYHRLRSTVVAAKEDIHNQPEMGSLPFDRRQSPRSHNHLPAANLRVEILQEQKMVFQEDLDRRGTEEVVGEYKIHLPMRRIVA